MDSLSVLPTQINANDKFQKLQNLIRLDMSCEQFRYKTVIKYLPKLLAIIFEEPDHTRFICKRLIFACFKEKSITHLRMPWRTTMIFCHYQDSVDFIKQICYFKT